MPPSKVLHLRCVPLNCTPEDLLELGTPFGKVVNTKCGVGPIGNQAFIEFADQNQATAMMSYYASSSMPAQVRGKNVYLKYSSKQEIVNKTTVEDSGNVLIVGMEGVAPDSVSIDVLHMVFSAFGIVHKIFTFEKESGYKALIQFSDAATAKSAKDAMDNRCIPSYLLPELDAACTLRITYSSHSAVNVKFQSYRSRDFTNPYLPFLDSAKDGSGLDGKKQEPESNILLASIKNMQYVVTIDVLHEVFSAFGFVQKIAVFEKNGFQALIQYPNIQTAVAAKEALQGHSIYEGGYCKLHLTFSRHIELNVKYNNDRGRDYTKGNGTPSSDQSSIPPAQGSVPSTATNSVMMPPGDPSVALPSNPSSEPLLQAPVVSSAGPVQYPTQAILQAPPGVAPQFPGYASLQFAQGSALQAPVVSSDGPAQYPSQAIQAPPGVAPQFPGYAALQFAQVSAQAQMLQPSGQESQQMSSQVNYQLPPGSAQFMEYLGNRSHPLPNMPGAQTMPYPPLGGQQLPPGPQMMQALGFGGLPFSQGPGQPIPQFPMYGAQQFPPGMEPQMVRFPEQGGQ